MNARGPDRRATDGSAIALTGATGFVGSALALELLARTDATLLCIARGTADEPADARLLRGLLAACDAYGHAELKPAVRARCRALGGDLLAERCGVEPALLSSADVFVHCAASLQYKDRYRDEILQTNERGTANALALAEAAEIPAFHYVSTAYVAGDREGAIAEAAVPAHTRPNNVYEESKIRAEALVAAAPIETRRVIRPSVVIGHSRTFHATSFTGMYGFIRALWHANRLVEGRLGGLLRYRPLRFDFAADFELNLIPVDAVARVICGLLSAPSRGLSHHHVANVTPPAIGEAVALLCETLGLARPLFSVAEAELSSIDREVSRATRFYQSYLRYPKTFETAATEAVVGRSDLTWDLCAANLYPYGIAYLEQLEASAPRSTAGAPAAS
jgi:nucleoside-diphosphate-sugar epimerase